MSEFTGKHTRQEFLQRLQDNGWVIRSGNYSDLDELERLYDYAEENDGDWLDELMAKVFETEVKTAESREEMRDAISQAGFDHDADELVFIEAYLKRNVSTEQIRQGFERIEQEKKEAQDKERRAQEDARESAYREEQNHFVSNVKARGWVLTNDEFRTLHRAGRNLPEDSPFRQKLKSMEAGNMHLVPGMTLTPQFEFQEWALRTELLSLKNNLQKLPNIILLNFKNVK